jgi:hypothetical protein
VPQRLTRACIICIGRRRSDDSAARTRRLSWHGLRLDQLHAGTAWASDLSEPFGCGESSAGGSPHTPHHTGKHFASVHRPKHR